MSCKPGMVAHNSSPQLLGWVRSREPRSGRLAWATQRDPVPKSMYVCRYIYIYILSVLQTQSQEAVYKSYSTPFTVCGNGNGHRGRIMNRSTCTPSGHSRTSKNWRPPGIPRVRCAASTHSMPEYRRHGTTLHIL